MRKLKIFLRIAFIINVIFVTTIMFVGGGKLFSCENTEVKTNMEIKKEMTFCIA